MVSVPQFPPLLELYPNPGAEHEARGAHLAHDIRARSGTAPFVFTGFISSLDGRIAVEDSVGAPAPLRNDLDWLLFRELMAQADVVVVSGRYVREVASGAASDILPDPARPGDDYLIRHRLERDLPPRPAVAIVTRSGGFDPATAAALSHDVVVACGDEVDDATRTAWEDHGLDTAAVGGAGTVEVDRLLAALADRGHRLVFSAAGPKVLAMLAPAVDALYLTLGAQLLGGRRFATLLDGGELVPPKRFDLRTAYLDPHGPDGSSQLFLEFRSLD